MERKWLFSFKYDLIFLFLPVWIIWAVAFSLPKSFIDIEVPMWVWVCFVLGIDVSHVWSTIFRTYLDKEEFSLHKRLLISAPLTAFAGAFVVAAVSINLFWTCLAYIAVFHFVKQQYGIMRIYKFKNRDFRKKWLSDNFVIYLSMLFPVIFWHLNLERNFEWFVEGDFIQIHLGRQLVRHINFWGNILYFLIIGFWLLEELYSGISKKNPFLNGKTVWILTTAGNWYLGIVFFNSDLVFTITNVVAHGVPYMALIIFYVIRKKEVTGSSHSTKNYLVFSNKRYLKTILLIISAVLVLAALEEHYWNYLVYQEEGGFLLLNNISFPRVNEWVKLIALAMLTVPQLTHYILDGFIWKNNTKNPHLKTILLN